MDNSETVKCQTTLVEYFTLTFYIKNVKNMAWLFYVFLVYSATW